MFGRAARSARRYAGWSKAQHEIEEHDGGPILDLIIVSETLEEGKQTDLKPTELTRKAIMPEALEEKEENGSDRRAGGPNGGNRKKAAA
ncbi:MAG: hypothetical protein WA864_23350 [Acetobacteraceae bacterium]